MKGLFFTKGQLEKALEKYHEFGEIMEDSTHTDEYRAEALQQWRGVRRMFRAMGIQMDELEAAVECM